MSRDIEIKEGAFILSDAHYSHERPIFLDFLRTIQKKELCPSQFILMGDIFDALFGEIAYTHKKNQEAIDILNKISQEIEVIYLEGNHDFNLKKIFPFAKVFPISMQPLRCRFKDREVLLSHGDREGSFGYKIYTFLIRNPFILSLLRVVDSLSRHAVLRCLDAYLKKKDDCKEFAHFESFIAKRLDAKYSCALFVEGHYHQNRAFGLQNFEYINLGAFACNQRYFVVKSSNDIEFLEEKSFSKGI